MKSKRHFVKFLVASVVFIIAGIFSQCNGSDDYALENIEPDLTDRNASNGKADESSPVRRVSDYFFGDEHPYSIGINIETKGINPSTVGVVYQITYPSTNFYTTQWKTAWAIFSGAVYNGRDNGDGTFVVEVPFEDRFTYNEHIRYAVFAIDKNTGKTYWDNNGGHDFFGFNNDNFSLLDSFWYEINDDNTITLSVLTVNVGLESAFITYTMDNWATYEDVQAEFDEDSACINTDVYKINVPIKSGAQDMLFSVRLEFDGTEAWANNNDHNYVVGLLNEEPAIIRFTENDYTVEGTLRRGGYAKVVYERQAQCRSCYNDMCSTIVDFFYKLYDDVVVESRVNDYNDGTPRHSEVFYIPRDAQNLTLWFHHTGERPPCSYWDSNNGNNYSFDLQ